MANIPPPFRSSFDGLSEEEINTHLAISSYNGFHLTDAIRPSYDLQIVPEEGYRYDLWVETKEEEQAPRKIPVIIIAATRSKLFPLFLDLTQSLGSPSVNVILETGHHADSGEHRDLWRKHIDLSVLQSILQEYEDLLLNDGKTGIAIADPRGRREVQFDENKRLATYGAPLGRFERVLRRHRIPYNDRLQFFWDAEHAHQSQAKHFKIFEELKQRLAVEP